MLGVFEGGVFVFAAAGCTCSGVLWGVGAIFHYLSCCFVHSPRVSPVKSRKMYVAVLCLIKLNCVEKPFKETYLSKKNFKLRHREEEILCSTFLGKRLL